MSDRPPPPPQYSPDGRFWWTGHQWITAPVPATQAPKPKGNGMLIAAAVIVAIVTCGGLVNAIATPRNTASGSGSRPTQSTDPFASPRAELVAFRQRYETISTPDVAALAAAITVMSDAAGRNDFAGVRTGLRAQATALRKLDSDLQTIAPPSDLSSSIGSWIADNEDWAKLDDELAGFSNAGLSSNFYLWSTAADRYKADLAAFSFALGFDEGLYGVQ